MTEMPLIIEAHFLPSLEYFCALWPYEKIIIEKHEHYVKQSERNRCHIMTSHGPARLSIPVKGASGRLPITAIEIDYGVHWQNTFWRTLTSAYAQSPWFLHYADALHQKIFSRHQFLYDLNLELLSLCLTWLRMPNKITESLAYEKVYGLPFRDLRNIISCKTDFRERSFYTVVPYTQVFGNTFAPNLSIIDLIFCEGPQAGHILSASLARNLNK